MTPGNKGGIELSAVKCRPMRCPFPEDTLRGMVEFSGLSIGSMARSDWNLKTQFWKTNYFVWILNKFSSITNQASTPHSPNILFCHMFSKNISLDYFFSNSRRIFNYLNGMSQLRRRSDFKNIVFSVAHNWKILWNIKVCKQDIGT